MNYAQQIKHPLWQKKRLEVLELHGWKCQECTAKEEELHVHHPFYRRGAMIWEYEKTELECLCHRCHKDRHDLDEKIKKELAVCQSKGLVLKYIVKLNGHLPTQKTRKAKSICVAHADKSLAEFNRKERQQLAQEAEKREVAEFMAEYQGETSEERADYFFAKMKKLFEEDDTHGKN